MEKKNFLLHSRFYTVFDQLSDAQLASLIRSITHYHMTGEEVKPEDCTVSVLFSMMKQEMDTERQKYDEVCEKNRENIKKRWKNAKEYDGTRPYTKNTDNDNDNENEIENDKDNDRGGVDNIAPGAGRFTPPTLNEIIDFCKKNELVTDAEKFYNYYTAKGWRYPNGGRVSSWQAEAKLWSIKDKQRASPQKELAFMNFTPRDITYGDSLFDDPDTLEV